MLLLVSVRARVCACGLVSFFSFLFLVLRYAQRPDSVAFSHASVQDRSYLRLLREMVTQRLTYDFQLVDNEEGSETTALSRMGRQLRYTLSMGHRIHQLEAAAPYTQVHGDEQ